MSISPSQDLQQQIFKALLNDIELSSKLGGTKIYERVPDRIKPPYIVLGEMTASDWSTFTEPGETVNFTLHVWSDERDRDQIHDIVAHCKHQLLETSNSLTDHHLINLRCLFSETRRDVRSGFTHGILRFRAVTEPQK